MKFPFDLSCPVLIAENVLLVKSVHYSSIFLIVTNKIHISLWNEKGFAESHYDFVIKHNWNISKVNNSTANRKQFRF